jgi:hypothetical protein
MLAAANANASLEEIRKRSEEDKAVWQREREELQQQVNRLQEEVLAAANANASLEEIRVQQNDHINKLLNAEKMRTKQGTSELVAEMPPSKKQKQDMPGKACDTDSFFKQIAGLSRQGDEAAIVQGMLTHSEHAGVQQQACEVLRSLANIARKRAKIAEAGGIEAVVAAMKATRVCGAEQPRSARQPEAAHQGSGRCGVCQARRQRQQCDSRHQDLGQ